MRKPGAVVFLILILLSLPWLAGGWDSNRDGLRAMAICTGTASALPPEQPFFRGGLARCTANEAEIHSAYRMTVVEADARLNVLRAALPFDVEMAQAAVEAHPEEANAHFWLGEALRQAGDMLRAIPAYEAGLTLNPTNGEEWDNLGRLYEAAGDWERAVQAFDQACHYVDQGKNGCPNAARLYMQHELYEQAIVRYMDTLEQLPGYPVALRGLADALIALERSEEAIPYLETLAAGGDSEAQALLEQLQESP
jgi:tetratricopeptide (TPR) repeat protein